MTSKIIRTPTPDSYTIVSYGEDIEFADPIQYYKRAHIESMEAKYKLMLHLRYPNLPKETVERIVYRKAKESWNDIFRKIIRTPIPKNLTQLLFANNKKEQEKLLKGLSINADQLGCFMFRAWIEHGYTLSTFHTEHLHKGVDASKLPTLINANNEEIIKVGDTTYTDGQLKQVIEHRKVIVAKFFDKDDSWHCLFTTYNSLSGNERGMKDAHFHYISDKFGKSREQVVEQLKSRDYKLGSLPHIDYIL